VVATGGNLANPNVYIMRLADGQRLHTLRGHSGRITAIAIDPLASEPVVVSGSYDLTVRVWRPGTRPHAAEPDAYDADGISGAPVAAATLPNGTPVVVSGGARVRAWREQDGALLWEGSHEHRGIGTYTEEVTSVATTRLPDGTPVVISGGKYGTARIWRLDSGEPLGEPLVHHHDTVGTLATASLDGTPIVISGGDDNRVVIWRLEGGQPLGDPLDHFGVKSVTTAELDGTPVVVIGSAHGKLLVWRLQDQRLVRTLDTTGDRVFSLAAGALSNGTPIVATAGYAGIRVRRLDDGELLGQPLRHDDGSVMSVAIGTLDGNSGVVQRRHLGLDGARLAPG
jgi:WD40 repeat protein